MYIVYDDSTWDEVIHQSDLSGYCFGRRAMAKCDCHRLIVMKFLLGDYLTRGPFMSHGRTRSIGVSCLPQLGYGCEMCCTRVMWRSYFPRILACITNRSQHFYKRNVGFSLCSASRSDNYPLLSGGCCCR